MAPTTATPNVLTGPGYLFWATLGTAEPTNTVVGSVFTDTWPIAWVPLGATSDGSQFNYASTINPIEVAEFYDPIKYATTARAGDITFNLANYTLTNLQRALNGGTLALVSGTGATSLNSFTPPQVGAETRCMIGWESADNAVRMIAYQTINGGSIQSDFKKAPALALIPCKFQFEVPPTGSPFKIYTAGASRVGV